MNFMNASNAVVTEITSLVYLPGKLFALGLPCAFILFSPKAWVDFVLRSQNPPDILNPWVGLLFLYMLSFFMVYILRKLLFIILYPLKRLFRKHNDDYPIV